MSDFLKQMASQSAERAANARCPRSADLDKPLVSLSLGAFDVIAEIKDRSPAEGELATAANNRAERAARYARGGAAAISVLTEPSRFAGSVDHLSEVVAAVPGTPVMRKDFIVDAVQILEARAAGASGVLLITTMLEDAELRNLLDCAHEHSMFVLLEAFDEEDLNRSKKLIDKQDQNAIDENRLLFGVNTRNLRTLDVDQDRLKKLAPLLPAGAAVAESGLLTTEDVVRVASWGYTVALVGTALMRSDDPDALIAAMRLAGIRETTT